MEANMMKTETTPTPQEINSDQGAGGDKIVMGLLTVARHLMDQGKPSQSLQAVVMAMKTRGGDEAVFQALNRAGQQYRNKLQGTAAADELASLFAECAIAEAMPLNSVQFEQHMAGPSIVPDAHGTSISTETGSKQIVLDAFSDGSNFVCLQCGGVVSNYRKEEHYASWCCKI